MRDHAEEGARIIERLGFLGDAVPGDQAPPRALRRHGLPGRAARQGDPARRADHPRRGCARLDADEPGVPKRPTRRRGARGAPAWGGDAVLPAVRRGAPSRARGRHARSATRCSPRLARAESARAHLRIRQLAISLLACPASRAPTQPPIDRDAGRVPGGPPQALHRQADPRRAEGERRPARPFADDAGVRGGPADDRPPADRDRAFRELEAAKRDAGLVPRRFATRAELVGAAAGARRGARPAADGARPRCAQGLGAVEVALLAHVRVADERAARGGLRRAGGGGTRRAGRRAGRRRWRGA